MKSLSIDCLGETFVLHHLGGLYWPREGTLMLADLHIGKGRHFRSSGIAVPDRVGESNLTRLADLLAEFEPARVLFLGDLFHSVYNRDWDQFGGFLENYPEIVFDLVPGNHDIMEPERFYAVGIDILEEVLLMPPFLLSHIPLTEVPEGYYNISGHIHPGVRLQGGGRQTLKLPCFYFGAQQALLPAFGEFTGLAVLRPRTGDRIYPFSDKEIFSFA